MSTNYGFGCRECGEREIVDNLRSYAIDKLQLVLDNLNHIAPLVAAGMHISLDESSYFLRPAIRFAVTHRARGHHVAVFDEYGREWDECGKSIDCPTCSHSRDCRRKQGHDGPCAPERDKEPA